ALSGYQLPASIAFRTFMYFTSFPSKKVPAQKPLPKIMPYGKLRMPYVTISFVPYAISCIFLKGMSYGTKTGGRILYCPV
ncbi:MAG: hypothetical protein K8R12_01020, partial [Desulfobacterales bacterium]|nr:hypothetical protein [Desulfobacterales bacterium]